MSDDYTSLSGPQRRKLLDTAIQTYGWMCCICGLPIRAGQESLQHVVPRSKGGTTSLATNKPAHKRCNYSLGNRVLDPQEDLIHNGEDYFNA